MALPILGIAAGIAARAAAKKAASRAVGGIVGKGAKQVNPVYRNIGPSVKTKPASKPTGNPVNQEKAIQSMISSAERGGLNKTGTLGKSRDHRVAKSKKLNWEPNPQKVINETKLTTGRPTIKIDSSKLKPNKIVRPKGMK